MIERIKAELEKIGVTTAEELIKGVEETQLVDIGIFRKELRNEKED